MSGVGDVTFRGIVRDGVVVPEEKLSVPDGTPVLVTLSDAVPASPHPVGSPQAVLAALRQGPHPTEEDVAALMEEIRRGRQPLRFDSPLDRD